MDDETRKPSIWTRITNFCSEHKVVTGVLALGATSAILSAVEQKGFERGQRNAMNIVSSVNDKYILK